MTNLIPNEIRDELTIDEQGRAFASRRAVARLAGIDPTALFHATRNVGLLANIRDGKNIPKMLEPFAGQDFVGDGKLPDILVAVIIQHYAFKGNETAQATSLAFQSIGIRAWIQEELGWKKPEPQPIDPIVAIAQGISQLSQAVIEMRQQQLNMEARLAKIERDRLQAQHDLNALPPPSVKAAPRTTRMNLRELVNKFCFDKGATQKNVWEKLYRELRDRYSFDVTTRERQKGQSKLDLVDKAGLVEPLYAIASELLV